MSTVAAFSPSFSHPMSATPVCLKIKPPFLKLVEISSSGGYLFGCWVVVQLLLSSHGSSCVLPDAACGMQPVQVIDTSNNIGSGSVAIQQLPARDGVERSKESVENGYI